MKLVISKNLKVRNDITRTKGNLPLLEKCGIFDFHSFPCDEFAGIEADNFCARFSVLVPQIVNYVKKKPTASFWLADSCFQRKTILNMEMLFKFA